MSRVTQLLCLAAIALLTTACGVKTAYNNADWLLVRWVNDRVSLTEDQERAVRASIEEHLARHCTNELPEYAAFLRQIDQDVAAGRITSATIESYGERVTVFGRRLLVEVRPALIDLLASLDDKQVSELMASFAERNLELLEEAELSSEALRTKRVEDTAKSMKRFIGRLTDEQRDRLYAWADSLETTAHLALEQRLAWQSRLAEALDLRHHRDPFEAAMVELLQPGAMEPEVLRQRRQANRSRTLETFLAMHRKAPRRQTEHLRDRLTDLAADLEEIECI